MKKIKSTLVFSLMFLAVSSSFFGHLFAAEVSGEITRMVVLGDSITCGVGASSGDKRYSSVLTAMLKKDNPSITEINMGLSGHALCQQGDEYDQSVIDNKPDLLVIQWGANDNFWGFSIAQFAIRYDKLLSNIRKARPNLPIVLMTLVPDFRMEGIYSIGNIVDEEWIGRANVMIQELAIKHMCHVAYVHRSMDHNKALYADYIHPNDAGAEFMAKEVVRALSRKPMSPERFNIVSDRGLQNRINGYLIRRTISSDKPQWYEISDISPTGMNIKTQCPIFVRSPPMYSGQYKILIKDAQDNLLNETLQTVTWDRMIYFRISEKDTNKDLTIMIQKT